MNTINSLLTWVFDLLLAPFASAPLMGLLVYSAAAGVFMTYVYGKTSNQTALLRVANRTRAQLLAIKLFKHDLGVTWKCQIELMRATGLRLLHSIPPMFVMILPFVIVMSQMALRYEHDPLRPGESTVVELQLAPEAWEKYKDTRIHVPAGVVLETESLRDRSTHTIYWRVRPEVNRTVTLHWKLEERDIYKQLAIAEQPQKLCRVNVRRAGPNLLDRILHPAEPGFRSDSPVRGVVVHHSTRDTPIFGIYLPWWGSFLIVSMLAALLGGRMLGVQF